MILLARHTGHAIYDESYNYTFALDDHILFPGDRVTLSFLVDTAACQSLEEGDGSEGYVLDDIYPERDELYEYRYVRLDFSVVARHHFADEKPDIPTYLGYSGSKCILAPLTPRAGEVLEWVFLQNKSAWEVEV